MSRYSHEDLGVNEDTIVVGHRSGFPTEKKAGSAGLTADKSTLRYDSVQDYLSFVPGC